MVDTDAAWESVARRDPYWGVITHPAFLGRSLTAETEDVFFASGEQHVAHTVAVIRDHVRPCFHPQRALDYGCGVGRNLPALAAECDRVVGLDVSDTMLLLARRHLDQRGTVNVELRHARDLPSLDADFDFVHCVLVLQHVSPRRGRAILDALVSLLKPGGCACVQFHLRGPGGRVRRGVRRIRTHSAALNRLAAAAARQPGSAQHVLMYEYDLGTVLGVLADRGISACYTECGTGPSGDTSATLYVTAPEAPPVSPGRSGGG